MKFTHHASRITQRIAFAMIGVGLAFSCRSAHPAPETAPQSQSDSPLATLFPASGQVPGWVQDEPPTLFEGEQIFLYMDGAGEIPCSYGFHRLGTAQYHREGARLEVVLFEMEDSRAAFGYYSVRDRWPEERFVSLDHPARLIPGFTLIAWKDCYTLVVRVAEGSVEDDVLAQFARALWANVRKKGKPPDLLRYLPQQDYVAGSAKYVRGKAAFDAEVKFILEDVFGLKNRRVEIVAGQYRTEQAPEPSSEGESYRLVLFRYPNPRDALQAYQSFANNQRGSSEGVATAAGPWAALDPTHQVVGAFREAQWVGVVLGAPERESALQILRDFQQAVRRPAPRWKLREKPPRGQPAAEGRSKNHAS